MSEAPSQPSGIVAVTGATGHVGANLIPALIADGHRVRVLIHHNREAGFLDGVDRVQGDVRDPDAVERLVLGARAVYHMAARIWISERGDDGQVHGVNVEGTRNVAAACKKHGARMVHFSSIHAFSAEPADGVVDESRALAHESGARIAPYDRSKAEADAFVRKASATDGLDAVIVNPTSIIGPYDFEPSPMGRTILAIARGKLPALVDGGFDFVDVRDVVAGARAAESRGRRGESYLLTGEWLSVRELALLVQEQTGVAAPRFVTPMWLASAAAPFAVAWARMRGEAPLLSPFSLKTLQAYRRVSRDRAVATLDYHPRPIRETIADTVAWLRGTGRLPERRPSAARAPS